MKEDTETLIANIQRNKGLSRRELFLNMAINHPAKFTNPDEVALEWQGRIVSGEEIPYVTQFLHAASNSVFA